MTARAQPGPSARSSADGPVLDVELRHREVLKQNTGSGKTVVGLLIAQSGLNEGVGPSAYLVPDTYLVQQVLDEAHRLGLRVTTEARGTDFLSGTATLVCTFEKVVNGRT